MDDPNSDMRIANMLLARLEHINADSHWAHRASGIRGDLLRAIEHFEEYQREDSVRLIGLMQEAFRILTEAAKEKAA